MDTVTLQLITCHEFDQVSTVDDKYKCECVTVFSGKTAQADPVIVACTGFKPSFKVLQDDSGKASAFISRIPYQTCNVPLHNLLKFSNETRLFTQYTFDTASHFFKARSVLKDKLTLFDAALPPSMQMLIALKMSPCAWVKINAPHKRPPQTKVYAVHWEEMVQVEDPPCAIAPFRVMAFDIECYSSHGEFPRAEKGYERTARELSVMGEDLRDPHIVEKAIKSAYLGGDGLLSEIHTSDPVSLDDDRIRLISEEISQMVSIKQDLQPSWDDYVRGKCLISAASDMGGDSIVDRISAIFHKHHAERVRGDEIIQIGATFQDIGSDEHVNHIFVIGECDDVQGATVHVVDCEKSLLRDFLKCVREMDPDFVTGYNIMGFDFGYIISRASACNLDLTARGINPSRISEDLFSDALEGTLNVYTKLVAKGNGVKGTGAYEYIDMCGRVTFDLMTVVQKEHSLPSYRLDSVAEHFTGERKNDISPAQIFASHHGTSRDRSQVASYCVQDCVLVLHLIRKLNIITNVTGMADVCGVPMSWIFMRGQGCKVLSLVMRQCALDGFCVPSLSEPSFVVDYEGATVLEPDVGAYVDMPVVVLDFSSLYPSSMISHNISHDTVVESGQGKHDLTFNLDVSKESVSSGGVSTYTPIKSGPTTVSFTNEREGVIPRILKGLLSARKKVRSEMKAEDDPFKRTTMDGLQLAYKITANSLYGQLGAPTSPVFMPELAASTTAVGRLMLMSLKKFIEEECSGKVIYGDTDSCFMVFPDACVSSDPMVRLKESIAAGKDCSKRFKNTLPSPHDAEYEKTFWPFVILSKKRYVGNMYSDEPNNPTRASMGLVLKRRDNAPIVKHVYGGVIDSIMTGNISDAVKFVNDELMRLVRGKVSTDMLVISKTLRASSEYKDKSTIAHAVLADRMNSREPGSAPKPGERVPYVFITGNGKLQGDRIEHPEYLADKTIDYKHYITNQLMKPLSQLFCVLINQLPGARVSSSAKARDIEAEVHRHLFQKSLNSIPTVCGPFKDVTSFFG